MTVVRVVQVRFAPEHRHEVPAVCALARKVFPTIPGVIGFDALEAADHEDWDFMFLVRFAHLEDVATYYEHPLHMDFAGQHMRPHLGELVARNYSE